VFTVPGCIFTASKFSVAELQQKAKDVVSFREQKIREQQVDKDHEIVRKKAELHDAEYREMRQLQLEKGWRRNALYRNQRTRETIDDDKGPQLCVVIKGQLVTSVFCFFSDLFLFS